MSLCNSGRAGLLAAVRAGALLVVARGVLSSERSPSNRESRLVFAFNGLSSLARPWKQSAFGPLRSIRAQLYPVKASCGTNVRRFRRRSPRAGSWAKPCAPAAATFDDR